LGERLDLRNDGVHIETNEMRIFLDQRIEEIQALAQDTDEAGRLNIIQSLQIAKIDIQSPQDTLLAPTAISNLVNPGLRYVITNRYCKLYEGILWSLNMDAIISQIQALAQDTDEAGRLNIIQSLQIAKTNSEHCTC
jgi:hypothetical protein